MTRGNAGGGYDLRVIISPAKKMRDAGEDGAGAGRAHVACDAFAPTGIPPFPEKSARVLAALRSKARTELQALWKVSDKLLDESCRCTEALELPASWDEACKPGVAALLVPAIFSYEGIQYQSMAPEVLDEPALAWLQDHLRVLSALHGCVRPLDAVMPYRLEMGARLSVDGSRDLYDFWGPTLGTTLASGGDALVSSSAGVAPASCAPEGSTCIVNLASVEYAKAVLPYLPDGTPVVTCIFGESLKDGRPVQRSTASKTARGSMVRWLAERQPIDPADLRLFDVGYRYDEALSRGLSAGTTCPPQGADRQPQGAACPSVCDNARLPATLVFMRPDA